LKKFCENGNSGINIIKIFSGEKKISKEKREEKEKKKADALHLWGISTRNPKSEINREGAEKWIIDFFLGVGLIIGELLGFLILLYIESFSIYVVPIFVAKINSGLF